MSPNHPFSKTNAARRSSLKADLSIRVIMLAEGIRPSPLDLQVGMPAPLLPIRSGLRLIDEWSRILRIDGVIDSPIEVVMASAAGFQAMDPLAGDERYERTIEPRSHRGTAGVLADIWRGHLSNQDIDYLVVLEGGSCPPPSFDRVVEAMNAGEDIILGSSEINRYAGVVALRPETLSVVSDKGYHDFKEQSLPKMLEGGCSISAVPVIPRAIRVRTLETWLEAVRSTSTSVSESIDCETGGRVEGHCCIAGTASIAGALVQNSVIMDGAVVEPGAIVARSAILAGQRVSSRSSVIDSIVGVQGVYERGGVE